MLARGLNESLDAPSERTDEELVRACARGDREALGELFDRFHLDVHRFASRLCGRYRGDVEDLVQSTFVEVQRAAKSFGGRSSVRTWLLGIAANVTRHHARAEGRRKRVLSIVDDPPDRAAPHDVRPDHRAEQGQMMGKVAEALEQLPHDLKVVFIACEVEGLPGTEVAAGLGIPQGTLWRRLHDARKAILAFIEGSPS